MRFARDENNDYCRYKLTGGCPAGTVPLSPAWRNQTTKCIMYLATLTTSTGNRYQLRQSYRTGENSFDYRIVFDLGDNPCHYIEPFDDHLVLFNSELLTAVAAATGPDGELALENLLVHFLPQETRRRLTLFQPRTPHRPSPLSDREKEEIAHQVHLFDRRRLYYLRYGAVDQSRLSRLHEKCCRPLLGQSRDEREYAFAAEEAVLEPGLYLQYVYAIFDVQKHFHQSFAPWFPEALARDEVAEGFIAELCRLNDDRRFWQGASPGTFLHHHLRRYLVMFFDFSPNSRSFLDDFTEAFMANHRRFRWPERKATGNPETVSRVFATPYADLLKMSGEQLSRLYRKQAMQLHPDRGGDHDLFIQLTEIYRDLQHRKNSR